MADIPFPSKDTIASTARTEPNLPPGSLEPAAADNAARTGSTNLLEEILSRKAGRHDDRRYVDHWGINE